MEKMELLSPAGSPACALAAFDAGADAVYAGLSKFNARERGENFTPDMMKRIVDYAHKNSRKVYLTLNTLLKESELPELMETLDIISDIRPDGVLVQDLGVLRLARTYYPDLILHGSTQMGFHNSAGLKVAEKLGLSRVVLERQITLDELREIRKKTDLELEVFVHGSLCCSLSGACLFSSYLGGWSGNRGKCKQPCRRRYFSKNGNGFFFSPQDLAALELLPELKKIGIESLKIEGRLRQPDYVHNTVSAYRMMLDCFEKDYDSTLAEARNLLAKSYGRKWSLGFYTEKSSKELIKSDAIGAAGLRVGAVEAVRDNGFGFTAVKRVHIGDRLRIQPPTGDDGVALTVTKMFSENKPAKYVRPGNRIFVCCDKEVPYGGVIFKIGESFADYQKRLESLPARRKEICLNIFVEQNSVTIKTLNAAYPEQKFPVNLSAAEKHPADQEKIFNAFAETDSAIFALSAKSTVNISGQWFFPAAELKKIRREFWNGFQNDINENTVFDDRICSLDKFHQDYISKISLPATDERLRETVAMKPNGAEPADRRAVRADSIFDLNKLSTEAILPEFCPESKLPSLQKAIKNAVDSGITRFRISSLFGFALMEKYSDLFLIASAPLPVCNSFAIDELADLGTSRTMAHIEMSKSDIELLRQKSKLELECYRLGRPSLLTTRAKIPFSGEFSDTRGNRFELRYDRLSGLSRIFPVKVISVPHIQGVFDFYDLRNANWRNSDTETFNFEKEWL